jgi:hypothetical protein
MNADIDPHYEEPVKLKKVEARPSVRSAEYWSPRIESLLRKLQPPDELTRKREAPDSNS